MKKIVYIVAGMALTATLMAGCSNNSASTSTGNTQTAEQGDKSSSTENGSANQKNFQSADLQGEVSNISGNKVTLKVIKTPERPEGSEGTQKNDKQSGDQKPSSDKQSGDQKPSQESKDGQEPQIKQGQGKMQVEYTGETKDITIDDGIQLTTMTMGRGKESSDSKTLSASDIKTGDILFITYSDKDKETISKISVRQASSENADNK